MGGFESKTLLFAIEAGFLGIDRAEQQKGCPLVFRQNLKTGRGTAAKVGNALTDHSRWNVMSGQHLLHQLGFPVRIRDFKGYPRHEDDLTKRCRGAIGWSGGVGGNGKYAKDSS